MQDQERHIGQDKFVRLAREGLLGSLAKVNMPICEPCLEGKAYKKPFGKAKKANFSLDLVHSDIYGFINVRAHYDASYFLI